MKLRAGAVSLVVLLCLALPSPAIVPPGGIATLSSIETDHVEIVYRSAPVELRAASLAQVVLAMAIAAGTPPSPWTPQIVEAALSAAGIPFLRARSCWPGDGSLVIFPTAPAGLADEALRVASEYYDPSRQAREFAESYWRRVFREVGKVNAPPGWPGRPDLEALKQVIVDALPFPTNLGTPEQYQARGFVPFLHVYGDYQPVCFLFVCFYLPVCRVRFRATSEGYGLRDVK